VNTYTFLC